MSWQSEIVIISDLRRYPVVDDEAGRRQDAGVADAFPTPTETSQEFHKHSTSAQRSIDLYHHIDPGFINWRKCFQMIGPSGVETFKAKAAPDNNHWGRLANGHLVVAMVLDAAREQKLPTLSIALQHPEVGQLFCSTERIVGNPEFWDKDRPMNIIVPATPFERKVVMQYGKQHIVSDTLCGELARDDHLLSLVGQIREVGDDTVLVHPIVIGSPWLEHPRNAGSGLDQGWLQWEGLSWFETFPEDVDEFKNCADVAVTTPDEWQDVMQRVPEKDVKQAFAKLLGDSAKGDWGGEQYDHFAGAIHLSGRRTTAAFVFKGPAKFKPMDLTMLGKNGDQIVRLASSTAKLLIVQHCHEILDPVRATLRSFAVAPHDPRRYCFIDGRDTFRILRAYGFV